MAAFTALVLKDLREVLTSRFFIASLVGGFVALVAMGAIFGASVQVAEGAWGDLQWL